MQVDIVNNTGIEQQLRLRSSSRPAEGFEQVLAASQAKRADAGAIDPGRLDQARTAAEQFVATAFVVPMLAQMRNDPFRSDLFHGGFAEDAFQGQLDTILADRMTQRADLPLVDSILDYILNTHAKPQDRTDSAPIVGQKKQV